MSKGVPWVVEGSSGVRHRGHSWGGSRRPSEPMRDVFVDFAAGAEWPCWLSDK